MPPAVTLRAEEELLAAIEFPGREDHVAYHGRLITIAENLGKVCQNDPDPKDVNRSFFKLMNMLIDNVIQGDREFRDYLPKA